jgi:glyoxylase-like metal-dependent hydrolase (beta-lactamase superfamily II)
MTQQISLDASIRAEDLVRDGFRDDGTHQIAPDLAYRRLGIVNVIFFGPERAGDRGWVLIDAGIGILADLIRSAARHRFGENARPAAIILTHGHFDHVGALKTLAEEWDAPVFAHPLEMPYLDGTAAYPRPDPSVGGGLMSRLSPLFPTSPVDVSDRLHSLPADGSVPFMPGWRWVFTPGHTPGHVSFFRDLDGALIAGDAFVTTAQESAYAAMVQKPEMHGPPMYLTTEWDKAKDSVGCLAALQPMLVITGHGRAMRGEGMRAALQLLARDFDEVAVPEHGRYLKRPSRAEDVSVYRNP